MTTPLKFVVALSVICLPGCESLTTRVIETETASEAELCRQWGAALPTRSRSDTQQTKDEIQQAYAAFSLACPGWAHLVP